MTARPPAPVLLTVETPTGAVDVVADGAAPLAVLLPALAAAAGLPPVPGPASGWRWWDGARSLPADPVAGLDALGVLSGSRLRCLPVGVAAIWPE